MHRREPQPTDFDPFAFNYIYRRIRLRHTSVLWVVPVVLVASLITVNVVGHTMGSAADFQLVNDLRRLSGASAPPAAPDFPLIRDVASWILLAIIACGAVAIHRQWQLMATCLGELVDSGALVPLAEARSSRLSKLLRVDRLVARSAGTASGQSAFGAFMTSVMATLRRFRALISLGVLGSAAGLAYLLVLGYEHGLFLAFAPPGLSDADRQAWLSDAYASWWASERHPIGYVAYGLLAWFAIFIILSYISVGIIAAYIAVCLRFVTTTDADWFNRDGRFGWSPLARVYRTVLFAVALLGAALTVTLGVLGLDNFPWIAPLVAIYCAIIPIFLLGPRVAFWNVERTATQARVARLKSAFDARNLDPDRDVEAMAAVVAEIERTIKARIRPLRLRRASALPIVALVLLPIILTAAEVLLPFRLGSP